MSTIAANAAVPAKTRGFDLRRLLAELARRAQAAMAKGRLGAAR